MLITIELISADDCYPLRSMVLRNGQDFSKCTFPEDYLETSFHLGALYDGKIISIGSFFKNSHLQLTAARNPYQLRGMATHPDARGIGAGAEILKKAETLITERGGDLLWFNAREKAFPFYEKSGYIEVDGIITVSDFGPHKVMFKTLR